ncbi:MAG: hypothetical protein IJH91_02655 [Mogibacterium sp.]|nr:hypothetical protein [Mogibacterium sp.]
MRLFKLKDADVWQKGTDQELMDLALRMIDEKRCKEVMSHFNHRITDENRKKSRREVELSRGDVWTLIRKIKDPKKKADFIVAGAYLADTEPYNAYSPKTQAEFYLQEIDFADFVIEQIPDENIRASICWRLPTDYSKHNGRRVITEAHTLARCLYDSIQSPELLEKLKKYEQFAKIKQKANGESYREGVLRLYGKYRNK